MPVGDVCVMYGPVCVAWVVYGSVGLCMGQWGNIWVTYGLVGRCMGQWGSVWPSWVMFG